MSRLWEPISHWRARHQLPRMRLDSPRPTGAIGRIGASARDLEQPLWGLIPQLEPEMTRSETGRAVKLTCFNCSDEWTKELNAEERIGRYGRIGGGMIHEDDVVCTNTRGYGTYAPMVCPTCGLEGPHEIEALRSGDNR